MHFCAWNLRQRGADCSRDYFEPSPPLHVARHRARPMVFGALVDFVSREFTDFVQSATGSTVRASRARVLTLKPSTAATRARDLVHTA